MWSRLRLLSVGTILTLAQTGVSLWRLDLSGEYHRCRVTNGNQQNKKEPGSATAQLTCR